MLPPTTLANDPTCVYDDGEMAQNRPPSSLNVINPKQHLFYERAAAIEDCFSRETSRQVCSSTSSDAYYYDAGGFVVEAIR
jgi:hypothetical protein